MNAKELLGRLCENAICGESSVYDCGDGAYMRLIKGAAESDFSKICGECEKLGYTIFQRNDLEENRHASYNGDMLIHIYFCPSEKACASYATRSRLGSSARNRNMREGAAALFGSLKTTTRISTAGCAISCAARTTAFLL